MTVSSTEAAKIAGWDSTCRDALMGDIGATDTITSGTISLLSRVTNLSVTGTTTFTLPDAGATRIGLRKTVICTVAASIPAGTLTVTTPESTTGLVCSSTFLFDSVGQEITFEWSGTKWRAIQVKRAGSSGANGVVVGTTVLTGKNMWAHYSLSVTGTVASTTTKGIPNGSAVGETIQVGCATAASIPSGTISLTGLTSLGAAATTLGTFNATTVWATLSWNGTGWQQLGGVTAVLS